MVFPSILLSLIKASSDCQLITVVVKLSFDTPRLFNLYSDFSRRIVFGSNYFSFQDFYFYNRRMEHVKVLFKSMTGHGYFKPLSINPEYFCVGSKIFHYNCIDLIVWPD